MLTRRQTCSMSYGAESATTRREVVFVMPARARRNSCASWAIIGKGFERELANTCDPVVPLVVPAQFEEPSGDRAAPWTM